MCYSKHMLNLETEGRMFKQGFRLIGGVDEAGRGPLAGPVVAACVVVDESFKINPKDLELVADSKTLSPKKREHLFGLIRQQVLAVEIGIADNLLIDKVNILQASFLAMKQAIRRLPVSPDYILLDGAFKIPKLAQPQAAVVKGDARVWTIAAASIIAKVSRDWLMQEFDKKYPVYGFAKHKGYGTKDHLENIKNYGPCPIHRLSFAPLKKDLNKN